MTDTFYKVPTDILDYTVDWEDLLGGRTIATSVWNVPSPLVGSGATHDSNSATITISGGVAGSFYEVTNTIVDNDGETWNQSFVILCQPSTDTSGVAIFSVTRNDIIKMALQDIQAYAPDFEDPTADAITRASERLNMMIKAWQAANIGLWLNRLYELTLTIGTSYYYLGPAGTPPIPRPLEVVEARYVNTDGYELPMIKVSRDEYMILPNKANQGTPIQYYCDRQLDNLLFYIWETASIADTTIKMTVRTPVQDFQNLDDYPDFPIEWADALHYNLAMRLIPAYNVPAKISADVKELAVITLRDADDFDREQGVSVQFAPDMTGYR